MAIAFRKKQLTSAGILKEINIQQASSYHADEPILLALQNQVATTMHKQSTTEKLGTQNLPVVKLIYVSELLTSNLNCTSQMHKDCQATGI